MYFLLIKNEINKWKKNLNFHSFYLHFLFFVEIEKNERHNREFNNIMKNEYIYHTQYTTTTNNKTYNNQL